MNITPTDPTPPPASTPPPAAPARFDLSRAVLVSALVLMGVCALAAAIATGVWLARRTPLQVGFGVGVAWLTALTVLVLVHNHPAPKTPS